MNGIRDDNFYTVLGWMLNVLELKGNDLIIFAIIYSFSQDGESEWKGSLTYLQRFANIKSQQTVITTLNELIERKYIIKREYTEGNVSRRAYRANFEMIDNLKKGTTQVKPNNKD